MISKLWLSWEKTSTTEQENRACSDVCWNYRKGQAGPQHPLRGSVGPGRAGKGQAGPPHQLRGGLGPATVEALAGGCPEKGTHKQDMDNGHRQPRATTQCLLTPSFLSRSSAPCRKSRDTSSFSSNHWMTKGSNHLEENSSSGTPLRLYGQPCPTRWLPILLLKW